MKACIGNDLFCPTCNNPESHPTLPDHILIRGFKVFTSGAWRSQCLVCASYYDANLKPTPENYKGWKGWFKN